MTTHSPPVIPDPHCWDCCNSSSVLLLWLEQGTERSSRSLASPSVPPAPPPTYAAGYAAGAPHTGPWGCCTFRAWWSSSRPVQGRRDPADQGKELAEMRGASSLAGNGPGAR